MKMSFANSSRISGMLGCNFFVVVVGIVCSISLCDCALGVRGVLAGADGSRRRFASMCDATAANLFLYEVLL